jgi:hypothetical protein
MLSAKGQQQEQLIKRLPDLDAMIWIDDIPLIAESIVESEFAEHPYLNLMRKELFHSNGDKKQLVSADSEKALNQILKNLSKEKLIHNLLIGFKRIDKKTSFVAISTTPLTEKQFEGELKRIQKIAENLERSLRPRTRWARLAHEEPVTGSESEIAPRRWFQQKFGCEIIWQDQKIWIYKDQTFGERIRDVFRRDTSIDQRLWNNRKFRTVFKQLNNAKLTNGNFSFYVDFDFIRKTLLPKPFQTKASLFDFDQLISVGGRIGKSTRNPREIRCDAFLNLSVPAHSIRKSLQPAKSLDRSLFGFDIDQLWYEVRFAANWQKLFNEFEKIYDRNHGAGTLEREIETFQQKFGFDFSVRKDVLPQVKSVNLIQLSHLHSTEMIQSIQVNNPAKAKTLAEPFLAAITQNMWFKYEQQNIGEQIVWTVPKKYLQQFKKQNASILDEETLRELSVPGNCYVFQDEWFSNFSKLETLQKFSLPKESEDSKSESELIFSYGTKNLNTGSLPFISGIWNPRIIESVLGLRLTENEKRKLQFKRRTRSGLKKIAEDAKTNTERRLKKLPIENLVLIALLDSFRVGYFSATEKPAGIHLQGLILPKGTKVLKKKRLKNDFPQNQSYSSAANDFDD